MKRFSSLSSVEYHAISVISEGAGLTSEDKFAFNTAYSLNLFGEDYSKNLKHFEKIIEGLEKAVSSEGSSNAPWIKKVENARNRLDKLNSNDSLEEKTYHLFKDIGYLKESGWGIPKDGTAFKRLSKNSIIEIDMASEKEKGSLNIYEGFVGTDKEGKPLSRIELKGKLDTFVRAANYLDELSVE